MPDATDGIFPWVCFPKLVEGPRALLAPFSYEDFSPASLYPLLERDCPQLRELHVRMDTPKTEDAKNRSLQWISEQETLPEECPELRELSFEFSEGRGKWEYVKTLRKLICKSEDEAGNGLGDFAE